MASFQTHRIFILCWSFVNIDFCDIFNKGPFRGYPCGLLFVKRRVLIKRKYIDYKGLVSCHTVLCFAKTKISSLF